MGSWSIVKKVGPPTAFEDSIDWLESGGWEFLNNELDDDEEGEEEEDDEEEEDEDEEDC